MSTPSANWKTDCANHDIDNLEQDPSGTWCYIRMYKCASPPALVSWAMVNMYGLRNSNTGDILWGAGGPPLGIMTCAHYGKYLEVWRVKVKRELMYHQAPGHRYSQCNDQKCDNDTFGWRYKDQSGKKDWDSKKQFALPAADRGTEWEDICLERVVTTECVEKIVGTTDMKTADAVVAAFKRDVLDTPVSGCESQSWVHQCAMASASASITV